jgi:hypothetical protein
MLYTLYMRPHTTVYGCAQRPDKQACKIYTTYILYVQREREREREREGEREREREREGERALVGAP